MTEKRNSRTAVLAAAMLLLGALAGLLVATESSGADPTYTRDGFVLAGAAPLEGATVTAFNPDTGEFASEVTLADGFYEFTDLKAGHYLFRYSNESYLTHVNPETVFADGMTSLDDVMLVAITGGEATLNGTITDAGGNVSGATVTLISFTHQQDTWWNAQEGYRWTTTTDASGIYNFSGMVDEPHRLRVSAADHYTEIRATVNVNVTENIALTEVNDDNLHYLYVKDDQGNTIRDATVTMYERATGDWFDAEKLGGATYVFRPRVGDYVFFARQDGFHTGVWATSVAGGASHTIELTPLAPGAAASSYTFADWNTLTWNLGETLKYDQGRAVDGGDVLLTGVVRFDIDRLWGNDNGMVETSEVTDYEAWEAWLGVPFSTADLTVDGEAYNYDSGYGISVGGVAGVGSVNIDDTGDFTRITDASFTAGIAASDSYDVALAVDYGTDRLEQTYSVGWPAGFEAIDNSTGNKVTVTGEGKSLVNVVTDPGSGGETITLTVTPNELPAPILTITSDTTFWNETHVVAPDEQVNFSAAGSTDTFPIVDYVWDFGDGANDNGEEVNYTYLALGTHTVTLTVEDSFGDINATSVSVLVDGSLPDPHIAVLVKETVESEGEPYDAWNTTTNRSNVDEDFTTIVFNGSASSDDDTYIVAYAWDFGDNTTDTGSVVNKQYSEPGEYLVQLTITDAAGNEENAPFPLTVNDVTRPEVAFKYSYEEDINGDGEINETSEVFAAAKEGLITTFNATLSQDNYDDAANLTYMWHFGDDDVIDGLGLDFAIVEHIFLTAPEEGFNVRLTVRDQAGNEQVAAQNIVPAKADKPDLFVIELNFSKDSVVDGDKVEITAHIGLHGINITTPFHVSFYVDSISNTPEYNATVANMTTGLNSTIEVSFTWTADEGNRNIFVIVDSGNEIEEASEKNTHSRTIMVKKSGDDGIDNATLVFIIGVVVMCLGVVTYLYRDRIFPSR